MRKKSNHSRRIHRLALPSWLMRGLDQAERERRADNLMRPMRHLMSMLEQGEVYEIDGRAVMRMPEVDPEFADRTAAQHAHPFSRQRARPTRCHARGLDRARRRICSAARQVEAGADRVTIWDASQAPTRTCRQACGCGALRRAKHTTTWKRAYLTSARQSHSARIMSKRCEDTQTL